MVWIGHTLNYGRHAVHTLGWNIKELSGCDQFGPGVLLKILLLGHAM